MVRIYRFGIALLLFITTGCLRSELPVPAHDAGNVIRGTVDMDPAYRYQIYYSLATNAVVGKNDKTAWDIGLETSENGYHVVLNGAKSMFALGVSGRAFDDVGISDTLGFAASAKCDAYTGSLDSTAIGDWRGKGEVYILNRGYDEQGRSLGWAKMQLRSSDAHKYELLIDTLTAGNAGVAIEVAKDSAYNLAFVSFSTLSQVLIEPPKTAWDVVFTQYTYVFYDMDPPVPYLVTGCLLNRNNTSAYLDTVTAFDSINYANVATDRFGNDISAIGYDWKVFGGNTYTVLTSNSYLVRIQRGVLYKLRFTGFYNSSGQKGNPQWEYQAL